MQASDNGHIFNHDLLANPEDLEFVRKLYPTLINALYDPELIDYFNKFNQRADAAKRKSGKFGTCAILLGGGAIALASVEVAIRVYWAKSETGNEILLLLTIGSAAAILGLVSVLLGASGILFGTRKQNWLVNRFMGESIRQFHFQSLIAELPLIVAMAGVGGEDQDRSEQSDRETRKGDRQSKIKPAKALAEDRQRRFLEFKANFDDEMQRKAKFGVAVSREETGDWRLCEPNEGFSVSEGEPLLIFFKAYRQIRLLHQLNYANYKLTSDTRLFSSMPLRQSQLLEDANKLGLQFVIIVHLSVLIIAAVALIGWLFGVDPGWAVVITPIFFFAIIALAVVSLSAHAFAQGLQPEREVERYQQYRSAVRSILERFDEAKDPKEKIDIMWEMERAAVDEMRNFLITYHEHSSFAV